MAPAPGVCSRIQRAISMGLRQAAVPRQQGLCLSWIQAVMKRCCTASREARTGKIQTRASSWIRQAMSTEQRSQAVSPRGYAVALPAAAWCSRSIRPAMKPCSIASRALMGFRPMAVWRRIQAATYTARPGRGADKLMGAWYSKWIPPARRRCCTASRMARMVAVHWQGYSWTQPATYTGPPGMEALRTAV